MIVRLLTEHSLKFLSLTVGCRDSPESTLVKMSNCWKFHAAAYIMFRKLLSKVPMALRVCAGHYQPTCMLVEKSQHYMIGFFL